jgi:phosphatidylglycerol:prolipoprotein diacylglycerol transferase
MVYFHNLNPFILGPWQVPHMGEVGIRWYSLPYILGFLALYSALHRAVVRNRIPNADLDRLEEASLLLILSIIVGGRVGYFLLNEPGSLLSWRGWLEIPQVWHGGMAFFGAVALLFGSEYFYCRKHRLGFWHAADRCMWIFALALGFGRLANFVNAELYGIPTNGTWGVMFPERLVAVTDLVNGRNVPRHPVQIYCALTHFLLAGFLVWRLRRTPRTRFDRVPGFTVFWFLGGYGLLRFITDFWRQERFWVIPGLVNGGQALSLGLAVVALVCARVRVRSLQRHGQPWDWYPEAGVDGELPPEAHAWRDREQP